MNSFVRRENQNSVDAKRLGPTFNMAAISWSCARVLTLYRQGRKCKLVNIYLGFCNILCFLTYKSFHMLANHLGMKLSRTNLQVWHCATEQLIGWHMVMYEDLNLLLINLPISLGSLGIRKLVIFPLFPLIWFSTDFRFDISLRLNVNFLVVMTGSYCRFVRIHSFRKTNWNDGNYEIFWQNCGKSWCLIDSFRPMHFNTIIFGVDVCLQVNKITFPLLSSWSVLD